MHLTVNGQLANGFWRIDNLDEDRVGIDFTQHPFAMVRELSDAKAVCEMVNASLQDPSA